jgi:hypothetical protein
MEQKTIIQESTKINSQINREEFEKIKSTPITLFQVKNTRLLNVPFGSVLTGLSIEERNKIFETLDKCQQTREIALDALGLLFGKKVIASNGSYWSQSLIDLFSEKKSNPIKLQKDLIQKLPECQVCQRGLWMLAQARTCGITFNPEKDRVNEFANGTGFAKGFTEYGLEKMESEYEESAAKHPYETNTKNKLANIICNILMNCGFKKSDKTDYLKKWGLKIPKGEVKQPNYSRLNVEEIVSSWAWDYRSSDDWQAPRQDFFNRWR